MRTLAAPMRPVASQQAALPPAEQRERSPKIAEPPAPLRPEAQLLWDGSPQPEVQPQVFLPEPAALAHGSRAEAPHAARPAL